MKRHLVWTSVSLVILAVLGPASLTAEESALPGLDSVAAAPEATATENLGEDLTVEETFSSETFSSEIVCPQGEGSEITGEALTETPDPLIEPQETPMTGTCFQIPGCKYVFNETTFCCEEVTGNLCPVGRCH